MKKLLLLFLLVPLFGWAQNVFDGTWKIDVDKSRLSQKPEVYLLKNGKFECKTCAPAFEVKADGLPQKVAGHPYFDEVAVKIINDRNVEFAYMKAGKPSS